MQTQLEIHQRFVHTFILEMLYFYVVYHDFFRRPSTDCWGGGEMLKTFLLSSSAQDYRNP